MVSLAGIAFEPETADVCGEDCLVLGCICSGEVIIRQDISSTARAACFPPQAGCSDVHTLRGRPSFGGSSLLHAAYAARVTMPISGLASRDFKALQPISRPARYKMPMIRATSELSSADIGTG